MNEEALITIITVVRNGIIGIENTILSVINQSDKRFKYYIIDGESTDGTLDIIQKYEKNVDFFISEPDSGIYYAMNKALARVNTRWVNFMNANDTFYDNNVLSNFFNVVKEDTDVAYGNFITMNGRKLSSHNISKYGLYRYLCPNHQSLFIKYNDSMQYDCSYKICADFDWFMNAFESGKKVQMLDFYVAKYDNSGISNNNYNIWRTESIKILERHYGWLLTKIRFIFPDIRELINTKLIKK